MHRSSLTHLMSCLAVGVAVAAIAAGCTSGSGTDRTTSLASGTPVASSGVVPGSGTSSVDVAADAFTCPSAAEINSLTAKGFTAAAANGAGHCEYDVITGSTQAVRVTIDHPPTSATNAQQSLAQFRAAAVATGNVVLTTAPQYSADSFIAQFGTLSCSVFALARDGEVMQVQASHQTPVPLDDCALAQSVTAVAGTSSRPAANPPMASGEIAVSPSADAPPTVSPVPSTLQPPSPASTPPATAASTRSTTATTTSATTKRPTTPTSVSEVLIFSTGPAAGITLPTPRPSVRPTPTTR